MVWPGKAWLDKAREGKGEIAMLGIKGMPKRSPSGRRIPKELPKRNYGKPKPTGRAAAKKQREEIAAKKSRRSTARSPIPTFSPELVRQNRRKNSRRKSAKNDGSHIYSFP